MWIYINFEGLIALVIIMYVAYKVWTWLGCPMSGDGNNG